MTGDESREESLWRLTAPTIATDDALPARCDVLVVGAGLTGLATARMLARAGRAPVVVEGTEIGALTTGGTTGKVSLLQGAVYSGLRRHAGDGAVRAYAAANAAAQDWLTREAGGEPEVMQRRSAYTYASTPEGERMLEDEARALALTGLDVASLGDAGFPSSDLPVPVVSALRLRDQAQVHPMRLLRVLADATRADGGTIVERCRLLAASLVSGGVQVTTTRGPVVADFVVLATGTPVLDRGLYFAKLTPSRELVGAYAIEGTVPQGMYLSVDPVTRSLRQAVDGAGAELLIVGGDGFTTGRGGDTTRRLAELDAWVGARFGPARRMTWWGAQDYSMVTRVPASEAMPRSRGRIFAATGYGKWGMTNAVAAALAIAGELEGERPAWSASLRPRRPGIRSAGSAITANAEVGAHLVTGWAGAISRARGRAATADSRPRVVREGVHLVAESTVEGVGCRVSGVCTHLGGVLEWNSAERTWDCPLHGSRFRPDGRLIEGPAVEDLKPIEDASVRVGIDRVEHVRVEVARDEHDAA